MEDIGDIAVGAAAEDLDKQLIFDSNGLAAEDNIGKAAESQHTGQGRNERRNMDIGDPEGLPCADGDTDEEHEEHGEPHIHSVAHPDRADSTRKADDRADGKVDIAAGQDAQQHTGRQHEHVSVLRDDVCDILRKKELSAGFKCEEQNHQHKDNYHCVFLEGRHCF